MSKKSIVQQAYVQSRFAILIAGGASTLRISKLRWLHRQSRLDSHSCSLSYVVRFVLNTVSVIRH